MYYDLNVPWPAAEGSGSSGSGSGSKKKGKQPQPQPQPQQGTTGQEQEQEQEQEREEELSGEARSRLSQLSHELGLLGYSVVGYNRTVQSRFDPVRHAHPSSSCISAGSGAPAPLSRLTVVLDDASMGKAGTGLITGNAAALQAYDVLAVQPTTEASFQHACLTLSELKPFSVDLIALDLTSAPRLPFPLRRSTVHAALENGVHFEVPYAPALAQSPRARRNLIACTRDLLRITNGRGILLSSAATDPLLLRAPHDLVNLAAALGIPTQAAKDAISNNPRALVLRARTRKTFRGVLSHPTLVPTPSLTPPTTATATATATPHLPTKKRKATTHDHPQRKKKLAHNLDPSVL